MTSMRFMRARDIHIGESLAIDGHVHIEGERHGHLLRLSMAIDGHIHMDGGTYIGESLAIDGERPYDYIYI